MRSVKNILALVLVGGLLPQAWGGQFNKQLSIGDAAPDWKGLEGTDGQKHSLADLQGKEVVVLCFTCNTCPYAVDCEDRGPEGTCGAIAILADFNDCLARGRPFPECLGAHVRPAGLRRCDERTPCRDDYLCVRTNDRNGGGEGACIPPYFLFQMRVDGHPHPPPG